MNILISILKPGSGGHKYSALTIGGELESRGINVYYLVDALRLTNIPTEYRGKVISVNYFSAGFYNWIFVKDVKIFCENNKIDLIHSFESYWGTYHLARLASQLKIGFYWTICGGLPPVTNFGLSRLATFSAEIKEEFQRRKYQSNIAIIPGRINITNEKKGDNNYLLDDCVGRSTIMFITRLSVRRLRAVKLVAAATRQLCLNGLNVRFIHVGHCQNLNERQQILDVINVHKVDGFQNIVSTIDPGVRHAAGYLASADIAIGVGRSAYESMAKKIPTLVVGDDGYAGIAAFENLPLLAQTNFSGRSSETKIVGFETSRLSEDIAKIISDKQYQKSCVESAYLFVKNNIDVKVAVDRYLQEYDSVKLQVNAPFSLLRYLFSPSLILYRAKRLIFKVQHEYL
jgi:glycosyltransferase involved in cell wall biosynthesis